MSRSRKYLEKREKFGESKTSIETGAAIALLKGVANDWESIDINIRLGINTRKADQNIRGTTVLPKGTGKTPTVLVLCKSDKEQEAKDAGADHVGLEEMIEKIKDGWLGFDMVIATPDVMKNVSKIAKILGPRGMMPNPKSGTVTKNISAAIAECKAGKVEYRADKTGIIHTSIGRAGFAAEDLRTNIDHLMGIVLKARPASVKGIYVRSIYLSATQTPSVRLDPSNFGT